MFSIRALLFNVSISDACFIVSHFRVRGHGFSVVYLMYTAIYTRPIQLSCAFFSVVGSVTTQDVMLFIYCSCIKLCLRIPSIPLLISFLPPYNVKSHFLLVPFTIL